MKLEIKHLAPYFPYDLECMVSDYYGGYNGTNKTKRAKLNAIWSDNSYSFFDLVESERGFEKIMPILRPLSDLTIDIIRQLISFDIVEFRMSKEIDDDFSIEVNDEMVGWTSLSYQEYQNIIAYHFDIFKLIPQGLAVDINTLSVE